MLRTALVFAASTALVLGSPYDPHAKSGSPWFEGWYTRLTTPTASYGLIVGYFPEQNQFAEPCYAAILAGDTEVLREYRASPKWVNVTKNGQLVKKDPEYETVPLFDLQSEGGVFSMQVRGDNVKISAEIDGSKLTFDITGPSRYWGPRGEGPEGWVTRLPVIGLHWFVYSLASPAKFEFTDKDGKMTSGTGFAHMEKNWGVSFPTGWIWAEGMQIKKNANGTLEPGFSFAAAGGVAIVAGISVPNQFLIGYRSEKLTWNFRPQDPTIFKPTFDACAGRFELTARSASQFLKIVITADPMSFATVAGPTGKGFTTDSVESFRATAVLQAYEANPLNPFGAGKLIEEFAVDDAALEFGGEYMCQS